MIGNSKDKKGSVTIFIMVFFVSLITLIFAFVNSAKSVATKSTANALANLWGTSILAEYDINLFNRYNIFGYYGMTEDVNTKINMYANYSFNGKKYIEYEGCSCNLYDYSLGNCEVVKEQIVKVGKLALAEKVLSPQKIKKPDGNVTLGTLNNAQVLNNLPSHGTDNSFSISNLGERITAGKSFKEIVGDEANIGLENAYMFTYFKDQINSRNLGDTFFQNEVEYILCGKNSDSGNAGIIKTKIIGLREIVNFAYIMKNPKMYAETMAAAETVTPGPMAFVTQKGIMAAWALAESINDYNILINGKKVPLMKTDITWAIDLQSIINNRESGYIDTNSKSGQNYKDYLILFATIMDENVKILRMMDLMEINMKYLYYGDFKLRDYNAGLKMSLTVNGDKIDVEKKY